MPLGYTICKLFKNLKSSMDRFIEAPAEAKTVNINDLKSSMDRFIAAAMFSSLLKLYYLKSSMDRFIEQDSRHLNNFLFLFKIQYG